MFAHVVLAELIKLRRSRITWLSWLATSIMPLMGAVFMWIVREPERAERLGLLGQKAQFMGISADWSSFSLLLLQMTGIGGMILVSVLAAYVFGREYADGTAKVLLTLPLPRSWFALAKLLVVLLWFALLIAWAVLEAWAVCRLMALPGLDAASVLATAGDVLLAAAVGWLLVPAVAWVALLGRGYLAPLGFTIFMLVMGNALGVTGWGKWFPWSIVPLFAGVAGPRVQTLAPGSLVVLALTFVAGVAALLLQLRYADNTQ